MNTNAMHQPEKEPLVSTLIDEEGAIIKLVLMFIDKIPSMLADIRQLEAAAEWEEFSASIHNLKGTAGNFGFTEISAVAENIEMLVPDKKTDEIDDQLNQIDSLLERIEAGRKYYKL